MHPLLARAELESQGLLALIEEMVVCESPSDSVRHVNQFVDLLVERTRDIAVARVISAEGFGSHLLLQFRLPSRSQENRVLALGHSDTVWPMGTLASMPFGNVDGRLWGPGVLDMKTGLAMCLQAVRILQSMDVPVPQPMALLIVSDEEVGSPVSRRITEREAQWSGQVLVLEPGTGLTGQLKTARKGVGRYNVRVFGRAAHAGVDFEAGASAIVEAAQQVQRCAALTDLQRGITVNPGVIRGGTRSNVIAADASFELDVRVPTLAAAQEVDRLLKALRPVDPRCQIVVEGELNRPPMERTLPIANLFYKARALAAELGFSLGESSTGGGSDGNFTAALGVPTLDGLGAVGEGAHAANESILLSEITKRTALLAALVS